MNDKIIMHMIGNSVVFIVKRNNITRLTNKSVYSPHYIYSWTIIFDRFLT